MTCAVAMPITRLIRRVVFVLARDFVDRNGDRATEYFTGDQRHDGMPRCSPFRADAFKFFSARSALECANTHRGMRDSEVWRVSTVVDMVPIKRR